MLDNFSTPGVENKAHHPRAKPLKEITNTPTLCLSRGHQHRAGEAAELCELCCSPLLDAKE